MEGKVARLNLLSRHTFITTEEQVIKLLHTVEETPGSLQGLLLIVDSNLVLPSKSLRKTSRALYYLLVQQRVLGFSIILVANPDTRLDKRLELQITHNAIIKSTEIKQEVTRL